MVMKIKKTKAHRTEEDKGAINLDRTIHLRKEEPKEDHKVAREDSKMMMIMQFIIRMVLLIKGTLDHITLIELLQDSLYQKELSETLLNNTQTARLNNKEEEAEEDSMMMMTIKTKMRVNSNREEVDRDKIRAVIKVDNNQEKVQVEMVS